MQLSVGRQVGVLQLTIQFPAGGMATAKAKMMTNLTERWVGVLLLTVQLPAGRIVMAKATVMTNLTECFPKAGQKACRKAGQKACQKAWQKGRP